VGGGGRGGCSGQSPPPGFDKGGAPPPPPHSLTRSLFLASVLSFSVSRALCSASQKGLFSDALQSARGEGPLLGTREFEGEVEILKSQLAAALTRCLVELECHLLDI